MSAVESGKAAPLVGGPPDVELQTVADELPSGDGGDTVPVALLIGAEMVPGTAETDIAGPVGLPIGEVAGIPDWSSPDGGAQVTTVPGVVGSEANGTGASVVSAVPGWVTAENGLGPSSGDVTIVPGVDGSPIAVLPMVETCARLALQPNSKAAAAANN
jgi:hypothetical protein